MAQVNWVNGSATFAEMIMGIDWVTNFIPCEKGDFEDMNKV